MRVVLLNDYMNLQTRKAYKLVSKNIDKIKHEVEAPEFTEKVFTRKVEVKDHDGKMVAEIKDAVREVGGGPRRRGGVVHRSVQTGKNLAMECAFPGHKEAGMHGTITIN